jgi:RNA polymerase sigma-70 factor, ECF subfamily
LHKAEATALAEAWNKMAVRPVLAEGTGCGERRLLADSGERERFEALVLPHLDAAHNLARWLVRREAEAQDLAQEAMLRAYRFFAGFRGGDPRAWLLKIVRNTCYTWLANARDAQDAAEFDEERHAVPEETPESLAIAGAQRERLVQALEGLPPRSREVLVLRELEGCSYKEIADITGIPIGTVMSSLSRARHRLQAALGAEGRKEGP